MTSHPSPDGISERVDALEVLARALVTVAPAPWCTDDRNEEMARSVYCDDSTGSRIADCYLPHSFINPANQKRLAEFIAACDPQFILALCTLVRGASEDRARLNELQRVVAMCDRVEIHDNTDDWQTVLICAGDEFGRGATIREALDDSITAYDEAMKIVAAARTPNQDSPNGR